jgi:hypothetical protein
MAATTGTAADQLASDRQAADDSAAADRREADDSAARRAGNKIWELAAKDRNEPPFHYTDAKHTVMVVAADERSARQHAAASDANLAPAGFMMREVKPPLRAPMRGGTPEERAADDVKRQQEQDQAIIDRRAAMKEGDPPIERERVAVDARSPWLDEDLTTCVEADLSQPRVIALDSRA